METLDFKLNDLEPIQINFSEPIASSSSSSSNFGSGIELLMNDKHKSANYATTIDMKDLDDIENELNDLTANLDNAQQSSSENKKIGGYSNFFGGSMGGNSSENIRIITEDDNTDSRVGQDTIDSISGNRKTWDGYSKVQDVPMQSRMASTTMTSLSEREKRRKKRIMLKNLDDWYEKGLIKTPNRFTMDSNYDEVEDEYDGALEDKRKKDSVKIQQNWMITMANTIEYGNAFFDPFGINLDGWGEAINEDIDSYDEIFEQLYEKYKGGKMSPELSLLLKLAFSASVIHFTNTSLSRAVPGFGDVMKQNPGLMKMFTEATVDSMKKTSPGMSFASELLNNNKPEPMTGAPPAPVETRNMSAPQRPGMQFTPSPVSNRPDISMGRGTMFRESGIDVNSGFQSLNEPQQKTVRPPQQQQQQQHQMPPPMPAGLQRPEMSGPKINDIDSILSGLKSKTVPIRESVAPMMMQSVDKSENISINMQQYGGGSNIENDSVISITSLKEMQNTTMPKRTNRRKPRSDKNVVSLDI